MARKIVITSGKGGVGKTTVAANLGYRLSVMGKRTCVVDADLGLNDLDVMTGVENLVVYDITDSMEGRCRAKQALIQSPMNKNFYVLPSVHSFDKSSASADNLKELIDGLSEGFDFVLIDCPAGIGGGFHRAVSASDEALVVVTPHISSVRDADKVLGVLSGYKLSSVGVVVNMLRGDLVVSGDVPSAAEIEDILKTKIAGVIPCEDDIMLSSAGKFPQESAAARAFRILAKNVVSGKSRIFDCLGDYRGFFGSIRRSIKRKV